MGVVIRKKDGDAFGEFESAGAIRLDDGALLFLSAFLTLMLLVSRSGIRGGSTRLSINSGIGATAARVLRARRS